MENSRKKSLPSNSSSLSRTGYSNYTLMLAVVWTIILIVAVVWDVYREERLTFSLVTQEARDHFNKDQAFRLWSTRHGGVYVPVDDRTPPNPYLDHIKERDIVTASGKHLTLMNPAYMLRQMMEEYTELYGTRGRITSTKPLNPDNAPDVWEKNALEQFEAGAKEVSEVTQIEGAPYLRLIRPMLTGPGCLKCHAHQGYQEGDIRGGVGVSVPLSPYVEKQMGEVKKSIISHLIIWGVGLLAIYTAFLWLGRQAAEQDLAEQALKESEEKYRLAMDATLDGLWDWDIKSGRVLYNKAWARILNMENVPPEYASWEQKIHPDEKHRVLDQLMKHIKGETNSWTAEHRLKTGDGQWKWVLGRGRVVELSEDGKPARMVGTMTDISERKKTEQALKESEERFKALHNASFGGIAIHDMGRIIDVNQGLAAITGFDMQELVGMDGLLLIAPDFRRMVMGHIRSGGEKPYEVMGIRKNGETYPLRLEARNIPFRGKPVRAVEFRDITDEKKAEAEHHKLLGQLTQARKMEAVGRLAGGVAHDFNNMLSIIIGNTEMALEDLEPGHQARGNLTEVQHAAERSADLTKQLLAFARKQTIDPKVLDLNRVIHEMINMLKRLIGEGIQLSWQPGDGLWSVKIDPTQIHQILVNLCINAKDAIRDIGCITIQSGNVCMDENSIQQNPDAAFGDFVFIRVQDNGCGMNQDTVSNLFEPFFTTKEVGKGSGLGLATVYGIVKQNEGFITVSSLPEKGTCFEIFLPRHIGGNACLPPLQINDRALHGTETVLLVEDETAILEMAAEMLKRLGYKVFSVSTPGQAIAAAVQSGAFIDLLITDVVMPEMNGRQLFEQLRENYPGIKSLFMSGYTADIIADHGVLEDGISFLHKPFTRQQLAEMVRAVLDRT